MTRTYASKLAPGSFKASRQLPKHFRLHVESILVPILDAPGLRMHPIPRLPLEKRSKKFSNYKITKPKKKNGVLIQLPPKNELLPARLTVNWLPSETDDPTLSVAPVQVQEEENLAPPALLRSPEPPPARRQRREEDNEDDAAVTVEEARIASMVAAVDGGRSQ